MLKIAPTHNSTDLARIIIDHQHRPLQVLGIRPAAVFLQNPFKCALGLVGEAFGVLHFSESLLNDPLCGPL